VGARRQSARAGDRRRRRGIACAGRKGRIAMKRMVSPILATALFLFAVLDARAQPAASVRHIGWLSGARAEANSSEATAAFRSELGSEGWVEGRDFTIVYRFADGRLDRLPELAAELVRMKVDVMVATTPAALTAARNATGTIPIVMVFGPDPVEAGLIASLAHPGGNITGLTSLSAELALKQLQLLDEIVPGLGRVAVLWNPDNPWHAIAVRRVESAAQRLHIGIRAFGVRSAREFDAAFAAMAQDRAGAALCLPDPMTFAQRARLAKLALEHRLPTMNGLAEYAEAGGLASYWPNTAEMLRRAASYVGRILAGARAGDLPVEQPTTFELVVNLKTAKALGISIPASVAARADRLIE
jgi:putative ABC transport system substrate-binding protein